MDLPPAAELSHPIRGFLEQPNYATLATVGGTGEPHQAVIWFRLDPDDRILVNSRSPRRWPAELRQEPRCSLAVIDSADPMRWVGLQTIVETIVDDVPAARDDIVAIAEHYGEANDADVATFRTQERISFRLRIVGVHDHLSDD
jgi:PPOX class probable F420-dependent enzyme